MQSELFRAPVEERAFSGGSCGPELPGLRGILRKKQTAGRPSSLLGLGTAAATAELHGAPPGTRAGLLSLRCSHAPGPQTRPGCELEQGPGSQEQSFTPMKWRQHCVHLEASLESKGRLRAACDTAPGVNTRVCTCVWEPSPPFLSLFVFYSLLTWMWTWDSDPQALSSVLTESQTKG